MPFWQPAAVLGSVAADGLRYAAALVVVLLLIAVFAPLTLFAYARKQMR